MATIPKIINYFEIFPEFATDKKFSDFTQTFKSIVELSRTQSADRFVRHKGRTIYIAGITNNSQSSSIRGKLLLMRTDQNPLTFNKKTEQITEAQIAEGEDFIELSHFILSYKGGQFILALEHNSTGAKISDFQVYMEYFMHKDGVGENLRKASVISDKVNDYQRRLKGVASITARILKDKIKLVKGYSQEVAEAAAKLEKFSEAQYVEIKLKGDVKNPASKLMKQVLKFLPFNRSQDSEKAVFEVFKVEGRDEDLNDKLNNFDFLNAWVKHKIRVEQGFNKKSIDSSDMFNKMDLRLSEVVKALT